MSETSTEVQPSPEQPAREYLPVSPEEEAQWVKRFLESGLSIRKFSKLNDIPRMSLWRWVRRAGERSTAPTATVASLGTFVSKPDSVPKIEPGATRFTEVKLPPSFGQTDWAVELTLPNGTVLRMTRDTPPTLVDQLLRIC